MAFSTQPELKTLVALNGVLQPLGYLVSQKTRVLDAIQAAADQPEATTPVGPTLMDYALPAMRKTAGPLCSTHAWLRPDDWNYAFRSHFDFVVHARLDGKQISLTSGCPWFVSTTPSCSVGSSFSCPLLGDL